MAVNRVAGCQVSRTPSSGPRSCATRRSRLSRRRRAPRPTSPTELVLGITNRSDTVNEFIVELDDPTVGWIRIEPPTKNIWPGARDTYRIIVQPPRSAEVRAGWKEYGLRIRSDGIPDGQTTASIRIEVLPFEAVDTRIVPRTSSGYTKGKHRIEVRNQGSAPWTANLTATDPEDVLRFQVPKQVLAMPGETLNVPVAVRPKAWTWVGSSSKHDFSVSLAREGGTPLKVDAQFNQRPFIPSKLIPPLIGAVVAAVVIALFAAGVIPPKPEPTAAAERRASSVPPSVPPSEQPTRVAVGRGDREPVGRAIVERVGLAAARRGPVGRGCARDAPGRRSPSFDVGDFVGPTLDQRQHGRSSSSGSRTRCCTSPRARTTFVVVRDPILEKFISITPDVADPDDRLPAGQPQERRQQPVRAAVHRRRHRLLERGLLRPHAELYRRLVR